MKSLILLFLCGTFAITGCNKHTNEDKEISSSQEQSTSKADMVDMTISAQNHIGLTISPAEVKQLTQYLKVTGTVQPIDSRVALVSPLAQGRILEVRAKVGDRVEAGQILATFDNVEAGELVAQELSARADLERMKAQLIPATRQAGRSRRLADIGAGAEKDYESSKASENEIEANIRSQQAVIEGIHQKLRRFGVSDNKIGGTLLTSLKAPLSGVVIKAQASPGDVVDAARPVFTVANLSHVWVQAEVYEKDLGKVRVGQNAFITVDTYPNRSFQGRVAYISDVIDPQTRTARVRCDVANPEFLLKTDMFANIDLPTTFSKRAIAVPTSALQEVEGKNVVFIRKTPTQFEAREVEKGTTVGDLTEIVSGLSSGEPVVTQGAFHLKSILAGGSMGDND
ncbi:MAG: efflux transporter periplasmic adaptor subunit [Acidobacteriales bacterium 59-55]|jgi:cobalt-zinc-cadmium efflux system membrane fusion protein|uniref:Cobalt-zinc-cadmium efflux system membrane fusion protein n=1 Tax=Acidipila rosea TaxID=768535 RepID=A0A4V2PVA8_9BACT|nr:efflux RND transporter periplasmic adaptor subunit [Acidipila rosea]MBN9615132.1 efflux RND transporter periplasmic adaptor subunit [Terriglobales bacterium]OJV40322.1 MAG: efflux transporter periplasmic adaptor subunit [Acidobacteriales bacterium 59-55]TCK72861.1 cobalt-zinc-cadmium efflux system membrane fusion protein [Acidipila rosea]